MYSEHIRPIVRQRQRSSRLSPTFSWRLTLAISPCWHCSTCRQHSTRSIVWSCCGGWRCHVVCAVTCWAGFSHTSTAARTMSTMVPPLPPSPFFHVEFHMDQSIDPSCLCCIWRTGCSRSISINSAHICMLTTCG